MKQEAVIKSGKVVHLRYMLKSSEGEVWDQADEKDPFVYLHGADQIVPGLEAGLDGLKVGDQKQVVVSAAEGYGEVDPRLKVTASPSQFPKNVDLKVGMQFATETNSGEEIVFTVESIQGDQVVVNGNHPLAGQTLHFDIEVLEIRDATQEEIEHGHAHGPGGHHDHDHDHDHDHGDCDHDH